MKIIIIGATGAIGKKVTAALGKEHDLIRIGRSGGDIQADISTPASIEKMYKQAGPFGALVSMAGDIHFGPLIDMTDKEFRKGIDSKLMGQVNLVLIGQRYISPGGSFTLTAGSLSDDPIPLGANASAVNAALEGFGRTAALELAGSRVRINVVSPSVVEDSPGYFPFFPGYIPVSMERVVGAYLKSVLGGRTGEVFAVR